MSISKINNSLSFKGVQDQSAAPAQLYRLDDETLYDIASFEAKQRVMKVTKNSFKTLLFIIPAADAMFSGFAHNGSLSAKLSKSASTLGTWGALFAAAFAVFGAKSVINNASEKLDIFDKNHRILSFGIDFAALYGVFAAITGNTSGLKNFAVTKFPKLANSFGQHVKQPLKAFLNKSLINTKLVQPYENFVMKHPHYNMANKAAACLVAPVAAVASVARLNNEIKHGAQNIQNNFAALKFFNDMLPEKSENQE